MQTQEIKKDTIVWFGDQSFVRPFRINEDKVASKYDENSLIVVFGEDDEIEFRVFLSKEDAENNVRKNTYDKLFKNNDAIAKFTTEKVDEIKNFTERVTKYNRELLDVIETLDNPDKCKYTVNYSNFMPFSKNYLSYESAVGDAYVAKESYLAVPKSIYEGEKELWNSETSKLSIQELYKTISDES